MKRTALALTLITALLILVSPHLLKEIIEAGFVCMAMDIRCYLKE